MLPLSLIMRNNQIAYHSYADDTQIYLALSPNDYSPIDSLCKCIDEINSWMCQNFLQLSKEKTEKFRIDFKVLLLVYKSLNGLGPKYIADMLTEYKPNRPLRSLGSSQLETLRVHTKQGESAFSYYAAHSWNQLPEEIRCAKTLATFKSRLKTHLFSCAFVE